MSDPICGPLIHSFVDETLDQVNYTDSFYFNGFEKRRRKMRDIVGKEKYFLYIKRKVEISSITGVGISDDGLT